ncbi:envelope glycoprotein B [Gallid alphaherpesvirus 1]|nr:envelope glycoprotein B [Gallid alphaherpesvirus 1]
MQSYIAVNIDMASLKMLICVCVAILIPSTLSQDSHGIAGIIDPRDTASMDVGKISFSEAIGSGAPKEPQIRNRIFACSSPTGASVARLAQPRHCHRHADSTNMTEGIAVVFKQNIVPYVFNVTLYYKHITTVTTWALFSRPQITNEYVTRVPIDYHEIVRIDRSGECSSKATYHKNFMFFEAYDNDEAEKKLPLVPSLLRSTVSKAFHTTNFTKRHQTLGYRTSTSVDCVVEYLQARSVYPYDYFGMATGDTVEISPFYTKNTTGPRRHSVYRDYRFLEIANYQVRDLETGQIRPPKKRNFLTDEQFTIGWDAMEEKESVCTLSKWIEVPEAVRVSYKNSYHFSLKDMTMTFSSGKQPFNISRLHLAECVPTIASEAIDGIFARKYSSTHVRSGDIEYYLGSGGFLIAFQKLMSHGLAEMYLEEAQRQNHLPRGRERRQAAGRRTASLQSGPQGDRITTHSSATFAMLQFAYDKIQAHVNELIGNLLEAWCEIQNRQLIVWHEMKKLNPNSLMTSLFGQPVSARLLGDIVAVSKCIEIPIENIRMQDSMRVPGDPTMCYTRPVLIFRYSSSPESQFSANSTENHNLDILGQLGEHNEILQGRNLIEPCMINHRRYFLLGENYLLYEDYTFVRQVNASEIEEVSTFINLNATILEDLDFVPVEVYTREELRDTGTLNYDDVVRYQNIYNKRFRDIDTVIRGDRGDAIFRAIADFFGNTLGEVGKALGTVVMTAAAAVISTVSGIASFLSNPFAALGIGIAVVVSIILGLLAFKYVMNLKSNPVQVLFPGAVPPAGTPPRPSRRYYKDEEEVEEDSDEDDRILATRVLKGLELLHKDEQKARRQKARFSAFAKNMRNLFRRKPRTKEDDYPLLEYPSWAEESEDE